MSQTGVEPAAFPLGVGAEAINPRQKQIKQVTFYQWIFCCAVNPSKEHKPRNKTSKRLFISRKLAELMKSGRIIVKCPPFISWEVYVSLRIFACLAFVNQSI